MGTFGMEKVKEGY